MQGAQLGDLSHAANRFNAVVRETDAVTETDMQLRMAERLRTAMESRIEEADDTDLSRLAWICIHLKDPDAAHSYASRGLELDPGNVHCKRLMTIA